MLTPTPAAYHAPAQRINLLDTIRGICLLGILLMNIQTYTLFDFLSPKQADALGWDRLSRLAPTEFLLSLFIRGQFYTIYSFLFGIGFYLMLEKNTGLELNGNKLYIRRLVLMLIFGILHCAIWLGDVLHLYAIMGIPLIFFYRKKVSVIFRWVAGVFIFGILLDILRAVFFPPVIVPPSPELFSKETLHMVDAYQHGSFGEIMSIQHTVILRRLMTIFRSTMGPFQHTFILFLLGLIAGKTGFFHRVEELKPRIKKAVLFLFPLALLIKVISCLHVWDIHFFPPEQQVYERLVVNMSRFIGVLLMALAYIGIFTLLLYKSRSRLSGWLGNAGRLGLTNYLAQTIICMLLFYPFGLGLTGKLTLWGSLLLALAVYIAQIVYSNGWLKYHRIGPLEAIWRKFTYGRLRETATVSNKKAYAE